MNQEAEQLDVCTLEHWDIGIFAMGMYMHCVIEWDCLLLDENYTLDLSSCISCVL